jgi:predicted O-linked N-acetylglucosamine transferase (SPINDLY family)
MDSLEIAKTLFLDGLKYFKNREFQDAERSFLRSLEFAPKRPSTLNNLAAAQIKLKKFDEAEINLKEVLEIDEKSIDLWLNLGALYLERKQLAQAITYLERCIGLDPNHTLAWKLIAQAHDQNREFNKAMDCFKKILESNPSDWDAIIGMGAILNDLKRYSSSIQYHQLAIEIDPNSTSGYVNMGIAFTGLKKFDLALHNYSIALDLDSGDWDIWLNKGNTLHTLKRHGEAIAHYDHAIQLKPDFIEAWTSKGITLNELKRYDEAIAHYDKATSLKADCVEAWASKGLSLHVLQRYDEAIAHYDKAISLKADCVEAWASKGATFYELKRYSEALTHYDHAIQLKPDYAEAWSNKGLALNMLQRYDEAIAHYDKAISLKPDIDWIPGDLLHTKMRVCDWSGFNDSLKNVTSKVITNEKISPPFALLALTDDAVLHQQSAKIYAQDQYPPNPALGPILKHPRGHKIRIGYFSADFKNHPVANLTVELFELHNKNRFEVFAFSFGVDDKSPVRLRLSQAFDQFIDVSGMSDLGIAKLSRDMQIDIAIDLGGYTADSRTGIFSHRAAPIQVSYIGYLGTMGADYIDYIIADKTLIPTESQSYYSEKVVYLPNSYQVNDRKRLISDKQFARKELGLPENSFVFCCFNNNYKILPATFDGWMRILKGVEGSVLFLYAENAWAKSNLKLEAEARGINSKRLVFGGYMPNAAYLARYQACDLFLDTFSYNAGTTASDALWAGLPILTLIGQSFASRVAASLLNAIGLPELITNTQEEYEALAIELAMNPEKLAAIKLRLVNNRQTTSLFDSPLFAKNLEAAYIKMFELYQADFLPEHIHLN